MTDPYNSPYQSPYSSPYAACTAYPQAPQGTQAPQVAPAGPLAAPRTRSWAMRSAAAVALAALALGGGTIGGAAVTLARPAATSSPANSAGSLATTQAAAPGTAGTTDLAAVVAKVAPSVVSIAVTGPQGSGEGSGFVVDADGTILTNAHVVSGATRVTVTFSDGRTAPATVLGADTAADVAVIRVSGVTGLTPLAIGDSGDLAVGDTVLAFGNPLGLSGSVTAGIVSALDRDLEGERGQGLQDLIQTDAAINPGNSGGPLVDTAGRVVGIDTANATTGEEGGSIGLGFAIPIENAMAVAERLTGNA